MSTTLNNAPVAPPPPAGGVYPSDEEILGIIDPRAFTADDRAVTPNASASDALADSIAPEESGATSSFGRVRAPRSEVDAQSAPPSAPAPALTAARENNSALPEWLSRVSAAAPDAAPQLATLYERASALETFDHAFYGADAKAQQQLVAQLYADDPAAFRAMVNTAARMLGESSSTTAPGAPTAARSRENAAPENAARESAGTAPQFDPGAYAQFEQSTNDAVVADVGRAIERALDHALPTGIADGARRRIAGDTLSEVHAALRGDQQLAAQVAEILRGPAGANANGASTARLDASAREAITRLITSRARGVVPEAARRVIGEWTGSVLATHRERAARQDAATQRVDVTGGALPAPIPKRAVAPGDINYRATSDEDILSW